MKQKNLFSKEITTFIHWSHKSWAIFSSMGKMIRIALLPLSYFLCSCFTINAQNDTVQIDDIEIISSRVPILFSETARVIYTLEKEDIYAIPVQSLQDLLEYFAGIDVRQRGNQGVQADIGIRGGNFDQTLILLNGFKMNDVQSGHHNLNLPIDIESIEKIEILEGSGNRVFGINSYSGAVNFITNSAKPQRVKISLQAGQFGRLGLNLSASVNKKHFRHFISLSGKKSNGYLPNEPVDNTDFQNLNLFYENNVKTKIADFNIQAGYSEKCFGANSFYSPSYPWQFENTKTVYAGYKTVRHGKKYHLMNSFYWRRHQDRFELFRESKYEKIGSYYIKGTDTAKYYPGIYEDWNYYSGHNYHKTNVIASELKYDFKTVAGKTAFGAEYNHAFIQSNVLGIKLDKPVDVPFEPQALYTKAGNRYNVNLYAEHVFSFKQIKIAGGISSNYNSDFDWNFISGADISYDFKRFFKLFGSINQAVRLPTYTDLYYSGPNDKSNPDLLPEHALTYEAGLKYFSNRMHFNINAFLRDGKNTIDRVRHPDSLKWQAQNITELTTNGVEFSGFYRFENTFIKKISISYAWLNISKQSGSYISKYVPDYLKHKAVISMQHKILKSISGSWNVRFEDRNGSYFVFDTEQNVYTDERDFKPFTLIDIKLNYHLKDLYFFTEFNNILNTRYSEYGNLQMPGFSLNVGISIELIKKQY